MPHPVRKKAYGTYGNCSLTNVKVCRAATQKGWASLPTPQLPPTQRRLAFDDVDDLMRSRAHDDVAAAHQDHLVDAPFRIDLDDPTRERVEADSGRHHRADRDVEVD